MAIDGEGVERESEWVRGAERERATCSLQFLRKHLQLTKADAEDNVLPNKPLFAHAVSHYASLPDLRCEHGDDEARLDSSMHVRCAHADGRMDAADTDSYAADGRAHRLRQRGGEDERGKEGGEIQESGGREGGRERSAAAAAAAAARRWASGGGKQKSGREE